MLLKAEFLHTGCMFGLGTAVPSFYVLPAYDGIGNSILHNYRMLIAQKLYKV